MTEIFFQGPVLMFKDKRINIAPAYEKVCICRFISKILDGKMNFSKLFFLSNVLKMR